MDVLGLAALALYLVAGSGLFLMLTPQIAKHPGLTFWEWCKCGFVIVAFWPAVLILLNAVRRP